MGGIAVDRSERGAAAEENDGLKMSLGEHLTELRRRLLRVSVSVLLLGIASLVFARPIFGVLMTPVLDALPPEARSLVYTSGIEEINVLMKVGLYAGIFLSTPVLLWQVWGFVAPGLYPAERKYAGPFVTLGTVAFLFGAAFCYFVVLPSMFQFLLQREEASGMEDRLEQARMRERDALRAVSFGEMERASTLARSASALLEQDVAPSLLSTEGARSPSHKLEVVAKLDGLGRMMDAASAGFGAPSRPVLRAILDKRAAALTAFTDNDYAAAERLSEEAASALAAVSPAHASVFADLWRLERELALGQSRHAALVWTRPMLTMHEQLSLVLLLELAFGIIFELPIVMALLALLGLLRASFLARYQRHALVVCIIAAAIITPTGDAVNLALMTGPMFLCYEIGLLAVWIIEKRRPAQQETTALAPPA
jgi:sec-independent protein translocase protein TatC